MTSLHVSLALEDKVCDFRDLKDVEFVYVYRTLFKDVGVRLLFTKFESGVLVQMNGTPSQLHPNSWVFVC